MDKESNQMSLTFKVQGEFITDLAREKCYFDGNYKYAIDLLTSCMESDELSKNEIFNMAISILDGRAVLKGTYPDDDYGFFYLDEKDKKWDLGELIANSYEENKTTQEKYNDLLQKYLFVIDSLDRFDKRKLNSEYRKEFDDILFKDIAGDPVDENTLLGSFLKRQMTDTEDDYGWLEPNGSFHPVEWGQHQEWADSWMKDNLTEDEYLEIDCKSMSGDCLTKKGWILLHNPAQGIAIITKSDECRVTKAQKEFLYSYYTERDCEKEANEIYST